MTVPTGTHQMQEVLEGGPGTCPSILKRVAQTALPGNLPFGTSGLPASAWGAGPAERAERLLVIKTILTEQHSQRPSGKEFGATALVVQSPTFMVQSSKERSRPPPSNAASFSEQRVSPSILGERFLKNDVLHKDENHRLGFSRIWFSPWTLSE